MDSVFGWLFDIIGALLAFFYSLIPNFGVAIILLTLFVMLLLYPLTAKQAKSMIAMQRVQPEIKKLQQKYKGDRQKLNEELMKFYQENKINPLAGCLPLLVQLPIFFALFRVLRDPQKYVSTSSDLYHALCDGARCAKGTVNHLGFLGLDLQLSATDNHGGFFDALPYFLLVALVGLTGFLSVRQAQKRTPAANKQMGMVMKVLPIGFTLFSISFPSGLVLYFVVSNIWRLGQQEIIFRRHGSAHHPSAKERREAERAKRSSAVIEAESRDVTADEGNGAEPAGPRPVQPAKQRAPKQAPAAGGPGPAAGAGAGEGGAETTGAAERQSRKGLRSLFQLPPPPESNGGTAASRSSARQATANGTGGRPPQQQQRKRSKKRKKRKR